ncbi:FIST C-terminal domain-containing protein [Brucepastera parasyntrophica]|uniref:FIST C-terminal domain-containing protein n=1 Tax=Brucepastera parasyntrophica TaxID=2880008 RepID=UPI00210AAF81|nr:FIST C-terminal domain-containing protein [Brucepastera parasyntrophica]ULQ59833.1 FIST C-terminal domain-containing protein [Brucepastera parasyntrophica]
MQSLGLMTDYGVEGTNAIPFVIDYNDGTKPIARAIYAITTEGYAACGGEMPVNATLAIGSIDYEDVIGTTTETVETVLHTDKKEGLLIFSCLARNLALGADALAEMETVSEKIQSSVPYHFSYSGGEICPVYTEDGNLVNRFHNNTFIACVF